YGRRGIWLSFSAKQRMERDAPLFTAKIRFEPAENLDAMVERIRAALTEGRSGRETSVDREVKTFLRLPAPALRLGVRVVRRLDAWGALPAPPARAPVERPARPDAAPRTARPGGTRAPRGSPPSLLLPSRPARRAEAQARARSSRSRPLRQPGGRRPLPPLPGRGRARGAPRSRPLPARRRAHQLLRRDARVVRRARPGVRVRLRGDVGPPHPARGARRRLRRARVRRGRGRVRGDEV